MERFPRPSAALVVAATALFISLGGVAAAKMTGMLDGHQLMNGSVTHNKLARNSVWAGQLGAGSVKMGNLDGSLQQMLEAHGAAGAQGPKGDRGDAGATGARGPAGISDYQVFTTVQGLGNGFVTGVAWCGAPNVPTTDQGWKVIGGGAQLTLKQMQMGFAIASSYPDPNNDTYNVDAPEWDITVASIRPDVEPGAVTLYAVCIKTQ